MGQADTIGESLSCRDAVRLVAVPHAKLDWRVNLAADGLCAPLVRLTRGFQEAEEIVTRWINRIKSKRIVVIPDGQRGRVGATGPTHQQFGFAKRIVIRREHFLLNGWRSKQAGQRVGVPFTPKSE